MGEGPHDEERGEGDDDVKRHLDRERNERNDVDRDDNYHDPETARREAVFDSRSCWSRAPDEQLPPKPPPVPEPTNEIVRCGHRPKVCVIRIVLLERYRESGRASAASAAFSL